MSPDENVQSARRPSVERAGFRALLTSGLLAGSFGLLPAIAATFDLVFIGRLDTARLAGATLVLPVLLLMQTMSLGALGGGIISAVARARGLDRPDVMRVTRAHGLKIALLGGALFAVLALLYLAAMAGGAVPDAEVRGAMLGYGVPLLGGAPLIWLVNALLSIERGRGAVRLAAVCVAVGAAGQLPLSYVLTLGIGDWPGLGVRGAALAYLAGNLIAGALSLALGHGLSALGDLFLELSRWSRDAASRVLRIGGWSLLSSLLAIGTIFFLNHALLRFGEVTVSAYGICMRYEFLLIPFVYGFSIAFAAPAARALAAGNPAEARRIATLGTGAALTVGAVTSGALWTFPEIWTGWFTPSPLVRAEAGRYLSIVAPTQAFLAGGLAAYHIGQAMGYLNRALLGSLCRAVIVCLFALAAIHDALPARDLYLAVAASFVLYGLMSMSLLTRRVRLWQGPALGEKESAAVPSRNGRAPVA